MKRNLTLALVLLFAAALAAVAAPPTAPAPQLPPTAAPAPAAPSGPLPAFLLPQPTGQGSPATLAKPGLPNGARFVGDPDCEAACNDQWVQCYTSCPACDQCSCQFARCRADCGDPFWGC